MLHVRAGCSNPTSLLYFSLTCALHHLAQCWTDPGEPNNHSSVHPDQWVSGTSKLLSHESLTSWAKLQLKNIWPFLNPKPSRDSPTQHVALGGTDKTMTRNNWRGCWGGAMWWVCAGKKNKRGEVHQGQEVERVGLGGMGWLHFTFLVKPNS